MKTHIILHHSLTKDSGSVSWDAIQRYHTDTLGWDDIGYHFGIERIGDAIHCLTGRPLEFVGAHCREQQMNIFGIGVCFVGNFDEDLPDTGALEQGKKLCASLCMILNIPVANILGHRECKPSKTCPGILFNLDEFRNGTSEMLTGKKYEHLKWKA